MKKMKVTEKYPYVVGNIRFTLDQKEKLREYAFSLEITVSTLIRNLVEERLQEMENSKKLIDACINNAIVDERIEELENSN